MTASPSQFPLHLAEPSPPWAPGIALGAALPEAAQPYLLSAPAPLAPEFELYEVTRRVHPQYLPPFTTASTDRRGRSLLVAVIASISVVAFLLLRCYSVLRSEGSLESARSFVRRLAGDDDPFSCSVPPEEASSDLSLGAFGLPFLDTPTLGGWHPNLALQLKTLKLSDEELSELTVEERETIVKARDSIMVTAGKHAYLQQRKRDRSERRASSRVEEAEETEGDKELLLAKQQLDRMHWSTSQDVSALIARANAFVSGRQISWRVAQALAARDVILRPEFTPQVHATLEHRSRITSLASDIVQKSKFCRNELLKQQQRPSAQRFPPSIPASLEPLIGRSRRILSDLRKLGEVLELAGMSVKALEVSREAESLFNVLESSGMLGSIMNVFGFLNFPVSPKPRRSFTDRLTESIKEPPTSNQGGKVSSAEALYKGGESSDDSSSSSVFMGEDAGEGSSKHLSSSAPSVKAMDGRSIFREQRKSTSALRGTPTPQEGMKTWRSFPELMGRLFMNTEPEPTHPGSSEMYADQRVLLLSPESLATPDSSFDKGEEPSDATDYSSDESTDASASLQRRSYGGMSRRQRASSRRKQKDPFPFHGGKSSRPGAAGYTPEKVVRLLQKWEQRTQQLLQNDSDQYYRRGPLEFALQEGTQLVSTWGQPESAAEATGFSAQSVLEIKQQVESCQDLCTKVRQRLVKRAIRALKESERTLSSSLQALQNALEQERSCATGTPCFNRVVLLAASTTEKSRTVYFMYSPLVAAPEPSVELSGALRRLAETAAAVAGLLDEAAERLSATDGAQRKTGQKQAAIAALEGAVGEQVAASAIREASATAAEGRPEVAGPSSATGEALISMAASKASTVLAMLQGQKAR
ncbi:hypothetical protein, conserved [Eimeria necatrix]|uniref:Transmembrane protein n=1 Tax=Eimeria necatrix TaxID=51315 RepID=U6N9G5_9EIME|nr:hypothetical protein, conserved [Eimeria necatrix]CDJ70501.1 hypothetical protein, conserved [Eimeria necatrix]